MAPNQTNLRNNTFLPTSLTVRFSERIDRVQPSPTLAITSKAKALIAQGEDVVSFGAGEPDFSTPTEICEAAKTAIDEGKTRYTPAAGITELRQAIATDYQRRQRKLEANEVIVCTGGKYALYNATQVLFDERDRVLIPTPFWVSYPAQIKLAGGEPVFVECGKDDDFKLTAQSLQSALKADPKITGLILCSPSNPTGAVYSDAELKALGDVLKQYEHITIFFDAMYDRLFYEGDIAPDLVACVPELASRVVTFNGFSKTYAMTGWRLGYAIASPEVISAMNKFQSQSTSNPTSFAQYGAVQALAMEDSVIDKMKEIFKGRRGLIVDLLNDVEGVSCITPGGAFYAFPDFNHHIGPNSTHGFEDDLAMAGYLLEEAKVAVVPGSAFGAPGHLRLSYATSDELIIKGVERIKKALTP